MARKRIRPIGAVCAIDGCQLPQIQRDWCSKHYMRWYRHGDPFRTMTPAREQSLAERLASRIDTSGGEEACWEYQGARHHFGYGDLRDGNRLVRAHRLAYELAFGPIPDGLFVCHRCDNPPCCNPAHLFVGTPADNVADMWAKGRARTPQPPRGEEWYRAHGKTLTCDS